MNSNFYRLVSVVVLGLVIPATVFAQADSTEPSLGDVARALRKNKAAPAAAAAPARPVIDNENFDQVVNDVEKKRLDGKLRFSLDSRSNPTPIINRTIGKWMSPRCCAGFAGTIVCTSKGFTIFALIQSVDVANGC